MHGESHQTMAYSATFFGGHLLLQSPMCHPQFGVVWKLRVPPLCSKSMLTSKTPFHPYDGFRASSLNDSCRVAESNLNVRRATPGQVRRVEKYIEANWARPLRIEDMATIAGSSTRSVYRAFRDSRGYSPMEFVKRRRLLQAHALLQDPSSVTTVTQVAFACGFSDASRFSKDFSKAYGKSPSAVRNRSK